MGVRDADYTVVKGDSSPLILVDVEGEDTIEAPWACDLFVVDPSDLSTRVIEKLALQINSENTAFEAFLTKEDTDGLAVQDYLICFEVKNADYDPHPFKQTIQKTLRISPKIG